MSFDTSPIIEIRRSIVGGEPRLEWTSTAPAGTWYQLYVNSALVWWGRETWAFLPMAETRVSFVVGVVDSANITTDYSAELPEQPQMKAKLSWLGGRYLAEDISHFLIFMGSAPDAAVSYAKATAEIPAFPGSQYLDGYGRGGYGRGGYGRSAQSYEWTSDVLQAGTWNFAIQSVDRVGNPCDTPVTGVTYIYGPPEPPERGTDGLRLRLSDPGLTAGSGVVTVHLEWLASPSAGA